MVLISGNLYSWSNPAKLQQNMRGLNSNVVKSTVVTKKYYKFFETKVSTYELIFTYCLYWVMHDLGPDKPLKWQSISHECLLQTHYYFFCMVYCRWPAVSYVCMIQKPSAFVCMYEIFLLLIHLRSGMLTFLAARHTCVSCTFLWAEQIIFHIIFTFYSVKYY